MAGKGRDKIKLTSTGENAAGRPTGTFYTTTKNKQQGKEKLSIKKFDPKAYNPDSKKCGMHVIFKEAKIK